MGKRKFDWEEAAKLYKEGVPVPDLAEKFKVGVTTIHETLKKLGVPKRSASEAAAMSKARKLASKSARKFDHDKAIEMFTLVHTEREITKHFVGSINRNKS